MISVLVKIVSIPILLILAMNLSENVNYSEMWQPFVITAVLILVGVGMEYLLLQKGTLWTSVALDFIASVLIIWLLSNMFNGAEVTFGAAIVLSLVLGGVEYFLHRYLIGSGKAAKDPVEA